MTSQLFFSKVEIARDNPDGCWEWRGVRNRDSYGVFRHKLAHRISYDLLVGPIGGGLTIDHLCRNRACVNPDHLEQVTALENYLRGVAARTHCPNGHEYTEENTARRTPNSRTCRICERAKHRAYHHRKRLISTKHSQIAEAR